MKIKELKEYLVTLSLNNISFREDAQALDLIKTELSFRTHLRCDNIYAETKGDYGSINISIFFFGLDEVSVAKQVSEELSEVASAVLSHLAGTNVQVQDVKAVMK